MSRIPLPETSTPPVEIAPIFDDFLRERGAVPNMFRALGHAPPLLRTFFDHFRAAMADGEVSTRVKELIAVRVSHLNRSVY